MNLEAHGSAALLEWQRAPRAQQANAVDFFPPVTSNFTCCGPMA